MSDRLTPPFRRDGCDVFDAGGVRGASGLVCQCENEDIARAVMAALTFHSNATAVLEQCAE